MKKIQEKNDLFFTGKYDLYMAQVHLSEIWLSDKLPALEISFSLELVSKELNHLAAILHVYAGDLNFMK